MGETSWIFSYSSYRTNHYRAYFINNWSSKFILHSHGNWLMRSLCICSGDCTDPNNYRPISNLSYLSFILALLINNSWRHFSWSTQVNLLWVNNSPILDQYKWFSHKQYCPVYLKIYPLLKSEWMPLNIFRATSGKARSECCTFKPCAVHQPCKWNVFNALLSNTSVCRWHTIILCWWFYCYREINTNTIFKLNKIHKCKYN